METHYPWLTRGSLSDSRGMIDRRPEARRRRDGLGRFHGQGSAEGHCGSDLRTEERQARMAAAEMEDRCTAMLRASGLVMIAVGSRMCQVSFGDEMNGALDDLSSARHHGQD